MRCSFEAMIFLDTDIALFWICSWQSLKFTLGSQLGSRVVHLLTCSSGVAQIEISANQNKKKIVKESHKNH